MNRDDSRASEDLWIFGYGSLVWKPEFPHVERRPAWLGGYRRRFWQGSTDHRGVPGEPGRVVTLVRHANTGDRIGERSRRCWGMAYRVERSEVEDVLVQLDQREKGGYERVEVELSLREAGLPSGDIEPSESKVSALMYVATPENPSYLGAAPLPAIAEQVRASRGPSGTNVEYVVRLAQALLEIAPELLPAEEDTLALARLVTSDGELASFGGEGTSA